MLAAESRAAGATTSKTVEVEAGGLPLYNTQKAETFSPALRSLEPIGCDNAQAWVGYWKKSAFIN